MNPWTVFFSLLPRGRFEIVQSIDAAGHFTLDVEDDKAWLFSNRDSAAQLVHGRSEELDRANAVSLGDPGARDNGWPGDSFEWAARETGEVFGVRISDQRRETGFIVTGERTGIGCAAHRPTWFCGGVARDRIASLTIHGSHLALDTEER